MQSINKIARFSLYVCFVITAIHFLLIMPSNASGQSKKELQQSKKNLQKEINETNRLLRQTRKSKEVSLNELLILNKKISTRERLINRIFIDVNKLDQEISSGGKEIEQLGVELIKLRNEYEKMVSYTYRNRNRMNNLLLILSSDDLFQAYKRIRYFQEYSDYQKLQAEMIMNTQTAIANKINTLNNQRIEKELLIDQHEKEKNILAQEKLLQNKVYTKLKSKEKQLESQKKAKEASMAELNRAIKRIIDEEIRKQQSKSTSVAKSSDKGGSTGKSETVSRNYKLTSEERLISDNFHGNMGKLPWPLERGVIISKFGKHPHPVLNDIIIENSGVDISTSQGAIARSVFKGTVTGVVTILGRKAVIIRHGEYLSVYANLANAFVSKGQDVGVKTPIGVVATDKNDGKTELHFEIRKGNAVLNPSLWISK